MTRKDYIAIATCLRQHRSISRHPETVEESAHRLCDVMADDNPRFDREHFMAVIRGEREIHSRPPR